jgi:hypothetical protein
MIASADKRIILSESGYLKIGSQKGREKISIGLTGTGSHFTITNNGERRMINAHITYDDLSRRTDYLCELSYFTWARLLVRMRQLLLPKQQQFFFSRRVNLGRLKRHRLLILSGNPDPDVEKALVKVNSSKTYIRSRKEVNSSVFHNLVKYPDEILTDNAKFYLLFSSKRKTFQGIIFRNPIAPDSKRYFLITNKMCRQFCKEQTYLFYSMLTELHFKNKENLLRLLEEKLFLSANSDKKSL